MDRLLLIDTANHIHRAYHALPKSFRSASGQPTNAIYGFTSMLISVLDVLKPTHVVAAMDDDKPTFRETLYSQYKATRKALEQDLVVQFGPISKVIDSYNIKKAGITGFEADDMIGTLSRKADDLGFDVVIISNDRDILQLLAPHVRVFFHDTSSKDGGRFFGVSDFKIKYGFDPYQLIDYKALRGDSSDNIPGVLGVGEKTALTLIQQYQNIENLYQNLDDIKQISLRKKLEANKDMAFLSKKLATIVVDAPIEFIPSDCRLKAIDKLNVAKELKKYNFKSLIARLGFEVTSTGDVVVKRDTKKTQLDEADSSQLSLL